MFWSFEYSLKKESNTIENSDEIEIDKQDNVDKQDNLGNLLYVNCDSPVWKRRDISKLGFSCLEEKGYK